MNLKQFVADIVYTLYEKGIFHEKICVESVDDTISALENSSKSLVRYGDGEISLIRGKSNITQNTSSDLGERLAEILLQNNDNLIIALPDIFAGLSQCTESSAAYWKNHLLSSRKTYYFYCKNKKTYANAFFSRLYYFYQKHDKCGEQFDRIKALWKGTRLIVVEGESTHNGVGNDLLDLSKSICRIICPSQNAYDQYSQILQACERAHDKLSVNDNSSILFLVSLGAAAKPLAYDLFQKGYRVIDIGNLDLEYEWYLTKAGGKETLPKHSVIGIKANREAGYEDYLSQIVEYIV